MNNKELEKLKQEYNDIKTILSSDFKEISELENNPIIKRYNYLKCIQKEAMFGDFNNDSSILSHCLIKHGIIEQTNGIYVYMFEADVEFFEKYTKLDQSYLEFDKKTPVIYYVDLENASKYEIVPKERQEEFEKTHQIVMGREDIRDASDKYFNLRNEFFSLCIEQDQEQEEVVKLVLQKYKRKV